ncbi:hypothetical protein NC653_026236 [Populus alba x Populus x berolinensis]|uniref:Ubiquitin-like domain-containing protein n=1 Tax=Populus alba x Populus x berolinensis TaxID=444605 RepID=A0AAD6MDI4_9ROSI|nr:hypothetical protein NC653_026236 [Populus alba x Populus x berolinensis]
MLEVVLNDRLGKKVRVKCNDDDTIGDLKKLVAAQTGTATEYGKTLLKMKLPPTLLSAYLTGETLAVSYCLCAMKVRYQTCEGTFSFSGDSFRNYESVFTLEFHMKSTCSGALAGCAVLSD